MSPSKPDQLHRQSCEAIERAFELVEEASTEEEKEAAAAAVKEAEEVASAAADATAEAVAAKAAADEYDASFGGRAATPGTPGRKRRGSAGGESSGEDAGYGSPGTPGSTGRPGSRGMSSRPGSPLSELEVLTRMSGGDVTTEADVAADEMRAHDPSSRGRRKDRRRQIRRRWKRAIKMVIRSNRVKSIQGGMMHVKVAKGMSVIEQLRSLEAKFMKNMAEKNDKIACLEASLLNFSHNIQGYASELAHPHHQNDKDPLKMAAEMHRNIEADRQAGFLGGATDFDGMSPQEERSQRARKRWHHAFWLVTRSRRISRALYGIMGRVETAKSHSVVGRIETLEERPAGVVGGDSLGDDVSRDPSHSVERFDSLEERFAALQQSLKDQREHEAIQRAQMADLMSKSEEAAKAGAAGSAMSEEATSQIAALAANIKRNALRIAQLDEAMATATAERGGLSSLLANKLDKDHFAPLQLQVDDFVDRFNQFTLEQEESLHDLVSKLIESSLGGLDLPDPAAVDGELQRLATAVQALFEGIEGKADKLGLEMLRVSKVRGWKVHSLPPTASQPLALSTFTTHTQHNVTPQPPPQG